MKYLLICSGLFLAIHSFGKDNQAVFLFDQLVELNKFWKDHQEVVLTHSAVVFANDRELIRMHLQLVESTLRKKNTDHLTSLQKTNRSNVLDILHAYWQKGVFPQNIYHQKRTPYFIDHLNTACAVGHLIIETGHEELAQTIALNDNYSLIEDLDYPELSCWAHDFGFANAELKWIQPLYDPCEGSHCDQGEVRDVSCHGGDDGCIFVVDIIGLPDGYYFYQGIYRQDTVSQEWDRLQVACNLFEGHYRVTYEHTDSAWYWDEYYDLYEPEPIVIQTEIEEDEDNCLNSVEITVTGGILPYTYEWSNGENGHIIYNLCPGIYDLKVTDANGCMVSQAIPLGVSSGTEGGPFQDLKIYPSPARDQLIIETVGNTFSNGLIKIYNVQGVEVMKQEQTFPLTSVDLAEFGDGVFYVQVSNGIDYQFRKFVKM